MGKHKAAQRCAISPWLSARADGKEGRFIQIGNTLLLDPAFQSLSDGAKHLYSCFSMESGGKREFIFPQAAATKYGIPTRSFRRHVKELISAGFITMQSGAPARMPNAYQFSFAWKQDRPP